MKKEQVDQMTLQEAVDYAVKKVVEQGGVCIDNEDNCVYGFKGKHCAVGWLLNADNPLLMDYIGDAEGLFRSYLKKDIPNLLKDNTDVFMALQRLHDDTFLNSNYEFEQNILKLQDLGIDTSGQHFEDLKGMQNA